jgi:hypothetical protein
MNSILALRMKPALPLGGQRAGVNNRVTLGAEQTKTQLGKKFRVQWKGLAEELKHCMELELAKYTWLQV